MSIQENYHKIKAQIPENVELVAVSKFHPIEKIKEVYDCGQKVFGENKVQELLTKVNELPADIQWHLIGHLQTNKVKYVAPFVSMIHAVDSLRLLEEINKQAAKNNRVIDVLLQFHIAEEETKFGFSFEEVKNLFDEHAFTPFEHVNIVGVMGMASFTENEEQIRHEFQQLNNYFLLLKSHFFKFNADFKHISMGMSNDYEIAIEEGATLIRVGSKLFGSRS